MKWINTKDSTQKPPIGLYVIVTNEIDVWLGEWNGKEWGVVYNGAPPFDSSDIVKWMLPPHPIKGYVQ